MTNHWYIDKPLISWQTLDILTNPFYLDKPLIYWQYLALLFSLYTQICSRLERVLVSTLISFPIQDEDTTLPFLLSFYIQSDDPNPQIKWQDYFLLYADFIVIWIIVTYFAQAENCPNKIRNVCKNVHWGKVKARFLSSHR